MDDAGETLQMKKERDTKEKEKKEKEVKVKEAKEKEIKEKEVNGNSKKSKSRRFKGLIGALAILVFASCFYACGAEFSSSGKVEELAAQLEAAESQYEDIL